MGLVGAFLLHLIIGASNRWNMLNIYATSHYKLVDDPYLTTKEDSYAAPFGLFCTGVGMRLGLRLVQLIGPIPMYVLAISGACINLLASSFMPALPCNFVLIQCS